VLVVSVRFYLVHARYRALRSRLEGERRAAREMSDLHLATIEALALAIDAKDQTARNHIRRVQIYASGVARAIGLPEPQVQAIKTAAMLHDIGKLAVPEHILAKPGPLTPEEFQKVRIHPQVGADIIGRGAIPGARGAASSRATTSAGTAVAIPRASRPRTFPSAQRILCIVDYFDALTSERPYHSALDVDAALPCCSRRRARRSTLAW